MGHIGIGDAFHGIYVVRNTIRICIAGIFTLFCLLLFVGAIIHSRCVLILFSVCGLFSIIFLWLLASVYTTASVALADFCYEPNPWVKHILKDTVNQDISRYYLECAIGMENPFQRSLTVSLKIRIFLFLRIDFQFRICRVALTVDAEKRLFISRIHYYDNKTELF